MFLREMPNIRDILLIVKYKVLTLSIGTLTVSVNTLIVSTITLTISVTTLVIEEDDAMFLIQFCFNF